MSTVEQKVKQVNSFFKDAAFCTVNVTLNNNHKDICTKYEMSEKMNFSSKLHIQNCVKMFSVLEFRILFFSCFLITCTLLSSPAWHCPVKKKHPSSSNLQDASRPGLLQRLTNKPLCANRERHSACSTWN